MFAAGLVAAIVVLVLRAADGHVSPGLGGHGGHADAPRADPDLALNRHRGQLRHRAVGRRPAAVARGPRRADDAAGTRSQRAAPAGLTRGISLDGLDLRLSRAARRRPCWARSTSSSRPGRTIALVGENGAGKTHPRQAAVRDVRADRRAGSSIDGVDLAELDLMRLAGARLSAAFQDFSAPPADACARASGSATFPGSRTIDAVRGALDACRLRPRSRRASPTASRRGSATASRAGASLSGGQWQRLALARGLMRERRCWSCSMSRLRASTRRPRAPCSTATPPPRATLAAAQRHDHAARLAPLLDRPLGRPDRRPRAGKGAGARLSGGAPCRGRHICRAVRVASARISVTGHLCEVVSPE